MLLRMKCILIKLIKSEYIFDNFVKNKLETRMIIEIKVCMKYQMNKLLANQKINLYATLI